jgi:hypothetical protein
LDAGGERQTLNLGCALGAAFFLNSSTLQVAS